MKLYLLRPINPDVEGSPWKPWYDKAFGFVVRAETELEARTLADEDAGNENVVIDWESEPMISTHPWLDPNLSTCIELGPGVDQPSEIILRDFASA